MERLRNLPKVRKQNWLFSRMLTVSKCCFSGSCILQDSFLNPQKGQQVPLMSFPYSLNTDSISLTLTLETPYYLSCLLDHHCPKKYTANHNPNLKLSQRQIKKTRKKRAKVILIIYITQLNILKFSKGS